MRLQEKFWFSRIDENPIEIYDICAIFPGRDFLMKCFGTSTWPWNRNGIARDGRLKMVRNWATRYPDHVVRLSWVCADHIRRTNDDVLCIPVLLVSSPATFTNTVSKRPGRHRSLRLSFCLGRACATSSVSNPCSLLCGSAFQNLTLWNTGTRWKGRITFRAVFRSWAGVIVGWFCFAIKTDSSCQKSWAP